MPEVWPHCTQVSGEASTERQSRKKKKRKPGGIHSVEETETVAEPVDKTAWPMFTIVHSQGRCKELIVQVLTDGRSVDLELDDQGLERFPHLGPPISDPPPISSPPFQARISILHLKPPTSDPPSQTPHLRPQARHLRPSTSDPPQQTLYLRPHAFRARQQIRPRKCDTPRFSFETTISGPTMSDLTLFVRDYNIRPRQCQTPHFLCETTISGPNNVRPTLFVRDYNIRPLQCQTPRFLCGTTISRPDNVRTHAFRAILQYQAPTMSDTTLFVRDYNIRPRQC